MMCCVLPLSGSLASAHLSKVGVGGYALAAFIGATVGIGCAWMMNRTGRSVYNRFKKREASVRTRYFRLLYLIAIVWIVFAYVLGCWITPPILRAFNF
jgi:hypothetical protein